MTLSIATESQKDRLLPEHSRTVAARRALANGVEMHWLYDSLVDDITSGYAVSTISDQYFTFEVVRIDGGFEIIPTSDWRKLGKNEAS